MNDDQRKDQKENLILFPGLMNRLIDKGMEHLKDKKTEQALSFFEQSLALEPDQPQARLGTILSLIELGRLQDAKEKVEDMLKEDIGDYYDVLKIYVNLLIQLSEYQEVVTIIEAVLSEDKLPPQLAESFYQLLHFSRQMTNPDSDRDRHEKAVVEKAPTQLLLLLENDNPEKQWNAIQQLKHIQDDKVINAFLDFLIVEDNDPVLKTMVLQALKDIDGERTVQVQKLNQRFSVDLASLEDVLHSSFGDLVIERLSKEIEHEDPTLFEMVVQVWHHYLIALYPLTPEPEDDRLWAAAIHMLGMESLGINHAETEVAERYKVPTNDLLDKANEISKVDKQVFQGVFF